MRDRSPERPVYPDGQPGRRSGEQSEPRGLAPQERNGGRMTLDQALAKASRELDGHVEVRIFNNTVTMLECGLPTDRILDAIAEQRAAYAAWRPTVLAQVRAAMLAF